MAKTSLRIYPEDIYDDDDPNGISDLVQDWDGPLLPIGTDVIICIGENSELDTIAATVSRLSLELTVDEEPTVFIQLKPYEDICKWLVKNVSREAFYRDMTKLGWHLRG